MGERVTLQVACLRKFFVTLVSGKYFLSCMGEVVFLEATCLRKSFVALVADTGCRLTMFLLCVKACVSSGKTY